MCELLLVQDRKVDGQRDDRLERRTEKPSLSIEQLSLLGAVQQEDLLSVSSTAAPGGSVKHDSGSNVGF